MSVNVTKWVWDQCNLSSSEKFVLLRLADHADPEGGSVYPGIKSVAQHTSLSERQVQRYIKSFVTRGILVIEDNAHGGRGKTTCYRFTFQNTDIHVTQSQDKTPTSTSPIETTKGDNDDTGANTQRVTPVTGKGDMGGQERVTPVTGKGDMGGQERVTPVTGKGDIHAGANPEPSLNRQNEPSGTLGGDAPENPTPIGSRRKPERPFPPEFVLDGAALDYAIANGFSEGRAQIQFVRMRNWAEANDIRRRDWFAQWRNWVLKDVDDNGVSPKPKDPNVLERGMARAG